MKVAIAGIHNEASIYSMHRADASFFEVTRGPALVSSYHMEERLGAGMIAGIEWVPIMTATSGASGPIIPEVYDAFQEEILAGFRAAGRLDGVYLDLHGAVAVDGRDNAEEEFVGKIREIVGPDVVLSASMDPHGDLSVELAGLLDLIAIHRHAPHIDVLDTRDRAIRHLTEVLRQGKRPSKVHVRIPLLLPGERTATVVEPGASVFGAIPVELEAHDCIDAALTVGFAWGDQPRSSAGLMVTGWSASEAVACARTIATGMWESRKGFTIIAEHSGDWNQSLDFVTGGAARPVWISDSGDNVTAGASGDVTFALGETIGREDLAGLSFLFAGLTDAESVEAFAAAGSGASLARAVGAGLDARYAAPVQGRWTVRRMIHSLDGDTVVAVEVRLEDVAGPQISVVMQRGRTPFVAPDDNAFPPTVLRDLSFFEPEGYDVVVVKNGYMFPSQVARAATTFMAITPGGTDLDFDRIKHVRVTRPLYPFDQDFEADLEPVVLRA